MRFIGQDERIIVGWSINRVMAGYIDSDGIVFLYDNHEIDLTPPGSQLCLAVHLFYVTGPLLRGTQYASCGHGDGVIHSNGDGYARFYQPEEAWWRINPAPIIDACSLKKEFRQLMKRIGILPKR